MSNQIPGRSYPGKYGNRMLSGGNGMKNGHLLHKIDTFEEFCEFFQELQIVPILQAFTGYDQVMGNLIPERSEARSYKSFIA